MPPVERKLPILLGQDQKYTMADVVVDEEPRSTVITIVVKGDSAQDVAGFLTAPEPIALSFVGIPVQTRQNHIKEP